MPKRMGMPSIDVAIGLLDWCMLVIEQASMIQRARTLIPTSLSNARKLALRSVGV
jgi:hypothetical protein